VWVKPAIVFVAVAGITLVMNYLPWKRGPGVPIEYAFQLGSPEPHTVQIHYMKLRGSMRVGVDSAVVLKKTHFFWIPLRDEFLFNVEGHHVILVRERPARNSKWASNTLVVSVDGETSHQFSG
jgi:hypothetical protein